MLVGLRPCITGRQYRRMPTNKLLYRQRSAPVVAPQVVPLMNRPRLVNDDNLILR